jgi:hypothetical protein
MNKDDSCAPGDSGLGGNRSLGTGLGTGLSDPARPDLDSAQQFPLLCLLVPVTKAQSQKREEEVEGAAGMWQCHRVTQESGCDTCAQEGTRSSQWLSHSASPFFVLGIFEVGSQELFVGVVLQL